MPVSLYKYNHEHENKLSKHFSSGIYLWLNEDTKEHAFQNSYCNYIYLEFVKGFDEGFHKWREINITSIFLWLKQVVFVSAQG